MAFFGACELIAVDVSKVEVLGVGKVSEVAAAAGDVAVSNTVISEGTSLEVVSDGIGIGTVDPWSGEELCSF